MEKTVITFEEFRKLVFQNLKDYYLGEYHSDEEIENYLRKENDSLKGMYNHNINKYIKGEMSEKIFRGDCVKSAAYCLYLMF